jgi:hypothetical protein
VRRLLVIGQGFRLGEHRTVGHVRKCRLLIPEFRYESLSSTGRHAGRESTSCPFGLRVRPFFTHCSLAA